MFIIIIVIINNLDNAGWLNLNFLEGQRGVKEDILYPFATRNTGTGFATQWQAMCSPTSPYYSPYSQLATSSMTGTRFPVERENLLFAIDFTPAGPTRRPMTDDRGVNLTTRPQHVEVQLYFPYFFVWRCLLKHRWNVPYLTASWCSSVLR